MVELKDENYMPDIELKTEDKILDAAEQVFQQKGLGGARMQEIADIAGINKALLHYYFRTKDKLFGEIFKKAISINQPIFLNVLNSEMPLKEKIEEFIEKYMILIRTKPFIPLFIINQLNQEPNFITKFISENFVFDFSKLEKQLIEEHEAGKIIKISAPDLITDIFAMCAFSALAKPMLKLMFKMDDKAYKVFFDERKKHITEIIFNGILKK